MFLETILDTPDGKKISKLARESTTYNAFYIYWRDILFERVMRLFVYEGPEESGIPSKEIEQRLHLAGHCGITKMKGELTAMFGSFFGVTKYQDEWTDYNVHCPIYAGKRKLGKDIVVINNNALRNPTYALVHHYASLLAHAEVTLVNTAVNARDAGGVPIATTEKQKQSIIEYQGKLYNGQYGQVTDIGNLGLQYAGAQRGTVQSLPEIFEVRNKLLKAFYSDIGVRSAMEKRSNTITEEVEADTGLLLLNLADMLKCREDGCKAVNAMFGTNWSVRIAEEINYTDENAPEAPEAPAEEKGRKNESL